MIAKATRPDRIMLYVSWVLLVLAVLMMLTAGKATGAEPPVALDYPPVARDEVKPAPRPVEKPRSKRVQWAGYWWDQRPDGTLVWCDECNGPVPASFGGSGVAASVPFVPGSVPSTGPTTAARPAGGLSTSSPVQARRLAPTLTAAPLVVPCGTTSSG